MLIPRLEAAAERGSWVVFMDENPEERVPWGRIHEDARSMAAALQARGIGPGERVALLGPTSRALATAVQATWLAGATLIVLPLRTRLTSEGEFWRQTRERIQLTDAAVTVADPAFTAGLADLPFATMPELSSSETGLGPEDYQRPPDDSERVAILQFTSGSTADPKGVMIPHGCLIHNLEGIRERMPIDADDDVVVSWAPLYHDMGLVLLFTYAMSVGANLAISTPQYFVASPARWMEAMSSFRGTWTIGPNFAFSLAARMLARAAGGLDLSASRGIGSGSEPIDVGAMHAFRRRATEHGFDPAALYGAYGMAEATVVIALPRMGSGLTTETVDASVLEQERRAEPVAPDHASAATLARVGRPIREMDMRIVDPDSGVPLAERELGEIEVRGPSVVPGYFRRPDATAAAFHDGWLRTGDFGFTVDGELVVGGRLSDMIIVGGRNVFPHDLERAAERVSGVRAGNVIAFGIEGRRGREEVVVAAEVNTDELERVRREVARRVSEASGLRPADVVLVRPGSLPKTSSGKLRRNLCRARHARDELDVA